VRSDFILLKSVATSLPDTPFSKKVQVDILLAPR